MSQYFQFNHLPLVEQPNVQLPNGILLDKKLCLLRSECSIMDLLSRENIQRAFFNLPLATLNRLNFTGAGIDPDITGSSDPNPIPKTYTIKGKEYKMPHQYFRSTMHFSTSICKENEGDEKEFHVTFVREFLSYYEDNYLKWDQTSLGFYNQTLRVVAAMKRSIEEILTKHLYEVIECPTRHSLNAKKDLVGSIDKVFKRKGSSISKVEVDNSSTELLFQNCGLFSTNFIGIHSYPDLIIGAGQYQRPEEVEFEPICVTLIGKTETPAMRLRGVYHLLTQKSDDSSDWDEINEVKDDVEVEGEDYSLKFDPTTGFGVSNAKIINDFQETVCQLVTTACYIGVNRVMLTTYTDTLLIHIDPEFVSLGQEHFEFDSTFDVKSAVCLKNKHYLIKSSDPAIRLKIASFFHVSDTSVNEQKMFQKRVGSYLKEKIPTVVARLKSS